MEHPKLSEIYTLPGDDGRTGVIVYVNGYSYQGYPFTPRMGGWSSSSVPESFFCGFCIISPNLFFEGRGES